MCSLSLFAQVPPAQGEKQEVRTDFDEKEIEKFVEANLEQRLMPLYKKKVRDK
jgi:hypothetical protein